MIFRGVLRNIFFLLSLPIIICSCSNDLPEATKKSGCTACHQLELDTAHQQLCSSCHSGNNNNSDQATAHKGLVPQPAYPDNMQQNCGSCHNDIVAQLQKSTHFTLKKLTNLTRYAFGTNETLENFRSTPKAEEIENKLALVDDLLRRRCFRCHLFSPGDDYPAVRHGTGCAACHLLFSNGRLQSHRFVSPGDRQCLSCHYGNYVGFDYYGNFERDYQKEYRTPFAVSGKNDPPYGVESHQLSADIHQQRGMQCIDCHSGKEIMSGGEKPTCAGCHDRSLLEITLPARVTTDTGKQYTLLDVNGKTHDIPLLQNPVHLKYKTMVACQSCHAQWTYNDGTVHFFREDTDEYDRWEPYIVQGDHEIQILLENNTDYNKTELPNTMKDQLSGDAEKGIWLKGYTERRWEGFPLGKDSQGVIVPLRRILDMRLTWLDEDEEVQFDSVASQSVNHGFRPYVPHTTGPAGAYSVQRIAAYLARESQLPSGPKTGKD